MLHEELSQEVRAYVTEHMPEYLAILKEMVDINSFTANWQGVNLLGRETAKLFAPLGFTAEYVKSTNSSFGDHLVLTRPGSLAAPFTIGLVSHLDTVFSPQDEKENEFFWREEGDRIYGPGTVDIKGGTVLIYMVLQAMRAVAPHFFTAVTWKILLDSGEEVASLDFGELCRRQLPPAQTLACLVFEGGNVTDNQCKLVVARKGMAVFKITVQGRAAHAGTSHAQGANAIVQLAEIVSQLAAMTDYERRLTLNIGTIVGGTLVNRVAHMAIAQVEMRTFAQEVYDEAVAKIEAFAGYSSVRSPVDDFACQVQVEKIRTMGPWPQNEDTESLLALWQETAAELNMEVIPEARGGLSDGNHIWDTVPTLDGLGPSGGNAHCSQRSADGSKEQEYVTRSSFVPKAVLNCMALIKFIHRHMDISMFSEVTTIS